MAQFPKYPLKIWELQLCKIYRHQKRSWLHDCPDASVTSLNFHSEQNGLHRIHNQQLSLEREGFKGTAQAHPLWLFLSTAVFQEIHFEKKKKELHIPVWFTVSRAKAENKRDAGHVFCWTDQSSVCRRHDEDPGKFRLLNILYKRLSRHIWLLSKSQKSPASSPRQFWLLLSLVRWSLAWFPQVHWDFGIQLLLLHSDHFVGQRVDPIHLHGVPCVGDAVKPVERKTTGESGRLPVMFSFHNSPLSSCILYRYRAQLQERINLPDATWTQWWRKGLRRGSFVCLDLHLFG